MVNILMVIPFNDIYPPMNGGKLRCFNLLNQLCKYFNVTALMHQDRDSFMQASIEFPSIKSCNVLSTKNNKAERDLFSLLPGKYGNAIRYRYLSRSLAGSTDSNFLLLYPQMKEFLKYNQVSCVILEDMSILKMSKLVRRYQPQALVIYDAYNVNSVLAQAALEKGEMAASDFRMVKDAEAAIFKHADKIFACSAGDLRQIGEMNQGKINGIVVPNGVGIPAENVLENSRKDIGPHDILFCGSMDYFPNQQGLTWFCENVFQLVLDRIPDARLLVVGKGNPGKKLSSLLKHPSIINYGRVDEVSVYYQKAAVAIVPLLSGSGTRLKLLEAMAYRVPVVATAVGAEGINYTEGKNILIADAADVFAEQAVKLLNDRKAASEMADDAFLLVREEYDWNRIGKKLAAYLDNEVSLNGPDKNARADYLSA